MAREINSRTAFCLIVTTMVSNAFHDSRYRNSSCLKPIWIRKALRIGGNRLSHIQFRRRAIIIQKCNLLLPVLKRSVIPVETARHFHQNDKAFSLNDHEQDQWHNIHEEQGNLCVLKINVMHNSLHIILFNFLHIYFFINFLSF